MRVYWSGAAMTLIADTRLRAASGNKQSLDLALASLQSCCLDINKRWRASELFKRLDDLTGTRIFSDLYEEHVNSRNFPDLSGIWHSLGVVNRSKGAGLSDEASLVSVRQSIMQG